MFENCNIWCWLIPLLCTLLGVLIGYWWASGKKTTIDNSAELKSLEDANSKLKADLAACNKKLSAAATAAPLAAAAMAPKTPAAPAFDAKTAAAAMGKKIKLDDLKVVEGIGPKIEQLFHSFDIKTWQALSDAPVSKCKEVLNSGGDRYKIHDPSSWPLQAKMCYKGEWKKLAKWQDEHKHGKL